MKNRNKPFFLVKVCKALVTCLTLFEHNDEMLGMYSELIFSQFKVTNKCHYIMKNMLNGKDNISLKTKNKVEHVKNV